MTVNSGGEKIFVEEVERAIAGHPAVADVVVTGRPGERWGNEVVAVVQLRRGRDGHRQDLHRPTAATHIARYKLPKEVVFVEHIERSPVGQGGLPVGGRDQAARRSTGAGRGDERAGGRWS